MTTPNSNQVSFLRTSRTFPEDPQALSVEIDRMYLDVSQAVNSRVIGLFANNKQTVTGESFFLGSGRQQTLRQVFIFTSTSGITHGINVTNPNQFTKCFGSYTDGTNSFGLIFGTSVAIAGQISFYITATQIVFSLGAGAPTLNNGRIILEWLINP